MGIETFGQRLRRFRDAAGLTQQALAERANLALRSINSLENDQRGRPREATIRSLVDALDLSAEQRNALMAPSGVSRAQQREGWRGALRLPPHELVGRERDLAILRAIATPDDVRVATWGVTGAVFHPRLITLVGPAGVGKTHLALHLAADLADEYRQSVYRADISGVPTPEDLPRAVARAIGLSAPDSPPLLDRLIATIGARRLLVILDGCEALLDPVAELVDSLLRRCAGLRFVVPSREPLQSEGEFVWRVEPLAVPSRAPHGIFRQNAAVRLFTARTAVFLPTFAITAENAALIQAVCYRAGGLPLALELLAGQLRRVPLESLVEELTPALVDGSLDALIAQGYRQLAPENRALLRCLACFADSWPIEAIRAFAPLIASGYPAANLRQLVFAGMIQLEGQRPLHRYRLHPAIRAFARAEQRAAGEEGMARAYHLGWCLSLAKEAIAPPGTRRRRLPHHAALDVADHDLAAALLWAIDHEPMRGRQLARLLRRYLRVCRADETSWARLLPYLDG